MDSVPLFTLIFYSIPESFLIFTFGLVLLKKDINWYLVIMTTVLSVTASYFARLLPLPYGFHTILGVLAVFILFVFILKLDIYRALIVSIVSICTLVALENILLALIQLNFRLSLQEIWDLHPFTRTLIGYPHLLLWLAITILLHKYNIILIK